MLAGRQLWLITKPGSPDWERMSPTSELLAEAVPSFTENPSRTGLPDTHGPVSVAPLPRQPDPAVILIGQGEGALVSALSGILPDRSITLRDENLVGLTMAGETLAANGARNVSLSRAISLLPALADSADLVLVDIPPSRPLARRWLAEAAGLLRREGRLLLAGAKDMGIESVIADAGALFGNASVVSYRRHCRAAVCVKGGTEVVPAWASAPGIAPGSWFELEFQAAGRRMAMASLPGVFAHDHLDPGTALLLENLPAVKGCRVLDAGCGYGVVGIFAGLEGAAHVDLVDVQTSATAAARENLSRFALAGEVLEGDALAPVEGRRYDLILMNPPFQAGKRSEDGLAEVFLRQSKSLLLRGGRLVVVANRFLRHDRLMDAIFSFSGLERLAENGHYFVLSYQRLTGR